MTNVMFLILLSAFATLSSLITEGIKNLIADKVNFSSNILALIVAIIIGCGGTAIYYQLNAIPFEVNNIIYLILMGLASGLTSMVGYDKVVEAIKQINDMEV